MNKIRQKIASELGAPTWRETNPTTDKEQAKQLWQGVLEDTGHPLLVHFMSGLIDKARIPARDPVKLARAIQLYSARRIKFFRERPERFQSAMRTIAWGLGDCDDKSRFIAAALRTFRIPVKLKFLRYDLRAPNGSLEKKGHVYPLAYLPIGKGKYAWLALESVKERPLGYDPESRAKSLGGTNFAIQLIGDSEAY